MFQGMCEPICVKLGMMMNITKLSNLIPVGRDLMFTQGHRDAESYSLCSHCVV